jgi:ribosome-binding factor A
MSRADRVAELIKHEVSDIISRKLNDPRIGFTSVTGVDIGADLQNAKIYVSVYGDRKRKEDTMAALISASGFIRSELAGRLELRETPEIMFKQDDSIERGSRVFRIINQLHQEKKGKKRAGSDKRNKKG